MKKQILFFAEKEDIYPIIDGFEKLEDVQYFQTGLFSTDEIPHYLSLLDIEDLELVDAGDWNHTRNFLVIPKENKIKIRPVYQKRGGIRYAVDQLENPESVVIKPSGVYDSNVLVAGSLGTTSDILFSNRLFSKISKDIRKCFIKIGQFYVGPNAKIKLDAGWRLVTSDKSPKEYDLKEPII